MIASIHLELIAQSTPKDGNVNLKYIAMLRSNVGLKAEHARTEEMHVEIPGSAKQFVFEVVMLEVGN